MAQLAELPGPWLLAEPLSAVVVVVSWISQVEFA
jgi:hypothetical protein